MEGQTERRTSPPNYFLKVEIKFYHLAVYISAIFAVFEKALQTRTHLKNQFQNDLFAYLIADSDSCGGRYVTDFDV